MRDFISRLLMPFFLVAAAPAALADIVSGTIEVVACGELDPFELGDACVVYGLAADGAAIGLVTTDLDLIDQYGYDGLQALAGQPLNLRADTMRALGDDAVIAVLNGLPFSDIEGRLFYWWDGTGVLGK